MLSCLKFLAKCKESKLVSAILKRAPDTVIKRICDAALNAQLGSVKLSPNDKHCFRHHRKVFTKLVDKSVSIQTKRRILCRVHKGTGGCLVTKLLSAVFKSLGTSFISRKACHSKSLN